MKVRTADLTGSLLDGAVAQVQKVAGPWLRDFQRGYLSRFSSDWSLGGPNLEELMLKGMLLERVDPGYGLPNFRASFDQWATCSRGNTILEAAYRAAVTLYLGEEFDLDDDYVAAIQVASKKRGVPA